jgi:hypothetical protein
MKYEPYPKCSPLPIRQFVAQTMKMPSMFEQVIEAKVMKQAKMAIAMDHQPKDILTLTRQRSVPEIDPHGCWTLQECQICHRHRYTIIFYHNGVNDLVEVTDAQILQQLRVEGEEPVIYGLN